MRRLFTVESASAQTKDDVLYVGVRKGERYAMFQRGLVEDLDPEMIYFEIDDQGSSGYDVVEHCKLNRKSIRISLKRPLGIDGNDLTEFSIGLDIGELAYKRLRSGLTKMFAVQVERLTLSKI